MPPDKIVQPKAEKLKPSQRKLLETLALEQFREAGAMLGELCDVAEIPHQTATRVLPQLVALEYVEHAKKGGPYLITEQGQQNLTDQ